MIMRPLPNTSEAKQKKRNAKSYVPTGADLSSKTERVQESDDKVFSGSPQMLTEHDIFLFKEGNHFRLYEKMGAHIMEKNGVKGVYFAVWAPNAQSVSVIGDFNGWNWDADQLFPRWDSSGIWEGFIPGIGHGTLYKFAVKSKFNGYSSERKDPFGFHNEVPPKTASVVWDLDYEWKDQDWMQKRKDANRLDKPMSVYEMHFGSWKRVTEEGGRYLNYREAAESLVEYLCYMGYTHVEFLPLLSHPFYGSWGYQVDGYFSPASLYGNPQDLMFLIDQLHCANIGVILDWVPSHFPTDEHSLGYFDGTNLYEHQDPKKGFHPDWKSNIFNYGRHEIRNFLISSALFWLDKYHIDGLRVDGVASMLYLDYSRSEGEWIPNEYGGNENLEAIHFLKRMNEVVYENYPDVQTIAEESTSWPQVSKPIYLGGLGFGLKWNMGWMHDTLSYFSKAPVHRKYHQNDLTFSMLYAFYENFCLSLSHDEVVHGKGSLINKMPGDDWQKFANLRLLYGYMFGHPGKKLLFMGQDFAQRSEWRHEESLEWHVLDCDCHRQMLNWVRDLNHVYVDEPALYQKDFSWDGFQWIDCSDAENSTMSFLRMGKDRQDDIVMLCNFTPVPRYNYRIGVPHGGMWKELLNSDSKLYGGGNIGNMGKLEATPVAFHGQYYSLVVTLPPLSVLFFKREKNAHEAGLS